MDGECASNAKMGGAFARSALTVARRCFTPGFRATVTINGTAMSQNKLFEAARVYILDELHIEDIRCGTER